MGGRPVFRDGQVHVLAERCATCVFRPGNLMRLEPGRLREMIEGSVAGGGAITCHVTLYRRDVDQAVCRGFYDAHGHRVLALEIAPRLGMLAFDPVPVPA